MSFRLFDVVLISFLIILKNGSSFVPHKFHRFVKIDNDPYRSHSDQQLKSTVIDDSILSISCTSKLFKAVIAFASMSCSLFLYDIRNCQAYDHTSSSFGYIIQNSGSIILADNNPATIDSDDSIISKTNGLIPMSDTTTTSRSFSDTTDEIIIADLDSIENAALFIKNNCKQMLSAVQSTGIFYRLICLLLNECMLFTTCYFSFCR